MSSCLSIGLFGGYVSLVLTFYSSSAGCQTSRTTLQPISKRLSSVLIYNVSVKNSILAVKPSVCARIATGKKKMSSNSSNSFLGCFACLPFLFLLLLSGNVMSQTIVKSLPGYGELPFTLETGYVSVGDVEFFYYFVESEGSPASDPLLLYMNGGPGCSGLNGFFYQIGPLAFDITNYSGGLPNLLYMPDAWTKTANVIFIDAPVGAGFSYATTTEAYSSSDTLTTNQTYSFIKNWLSNHTDYITNPFFLGSDSYSGIIVPMLAQTIIEGNEAGEEPQVNLKGYILSCPHTDTNLETNSKIPYAHRMGLISDELYAVAKTNCNGNYVDNTNASCTESLASITVCTEQISSQHILEPNCAFLSPETKKDGARRSSLEENTRKSRLPSSKFRDLWCHNFNYLLSDIWTNYESVLEALDVRPGTVSKFYRCNISLSYTVNVNNVVPIHKNLTTTGMQILVFSGDHDMVMPHNGIEKWITKLDISIESDWRPWFIDGQVAGYTRKYTNSGYRLTYATIKGAGHSPHEYKRSDVYDMFNRWIHYYPL